VGDEGRSCIWQAICFLTENVSSLLNRRITRSSDVVVVWRLKPVPTLLNNMHQPDPPGVAALVGHIYEAALDNRRWGDFLSAFTGRLKSQTGLIFANDFSDRSVEIAGPGNSFFTGHNFDPAFSESFAAYYGQRNVWLEDPSLHQEGKVVTSAMLYPEHRLKKTEYWADWLRPQNIFHCAAAIIEKRNDRSVNITVVRSEAAGSYSPDELGVIELLVPHLQAGFALHRKLHRLQALSHASTHVLESIPFGVVLLDDAARVLHVTQRANDLAAASGLLRLRDRGAVQCTLAANDQVLQRLLHEATRTGTASPGGAGGALRLSGLDGQQLQLLVTPLPSWSSPFGAHTAAAIFLSDPKVLIGSLVGMLRSLYGMTPAEARLTEALVNGRTPQEYAEGQQVSMNTVRTQIKAAAAKVGASRQTDLVRIVLTGPAVLRRPGA
jgi:DNA-binding CsgD family transcriptional regulator